MGCGIDAMVGEIADWRLPIADCLSLGAALVLVLISD